MWQNLQVKITHCSWDLRAACCRPENTSGHGSKGSGMTCAMPAGKSGTPSLCGTLATPGLQVSLVFGHELLFA